MDERFDALCEALQAEYPELSNRETVQLAMVGLQALADTVKDLNNK